MSEEGLLKQALIIALSPTYKYIASLVSVAGLVCLAYNEATHPHLVRGNTLWQVLEAVHLRRPLHGITEGEALENRKLLRYRYQGFIQDLESEHAHTPLRGLGAFGRHAIYWVSWSIWEACI